MVGPAASIKEAQRLLKSNDIAAFDCQRIYLMCAIGRIRARQIPVMLNIFGSSLTDRASCDQDL